MSFLPEVSPQIFKKKMNSKRLKEISHHALKKITVTLYYTIALDSNYVWGERKKEKYWFYDYHNVCPFLSPLTTQFTNDMCPMA